jgi:hypothetical protein
VGYTPDFILECPKSIKAESCGVRRWPKPVENLSGFSVDVAHVLDLMSLLLFVGLVDADSINPNNAVLVA